MLVEIPAEDRADRSGAGPAVPLADRLRRTPGDAVVGQVAGDHAARAHHDVPADVLPAARSPRCPSQASSPIVTGRSGIAWWEIGRLEVFVPVVLVGDVDVGTRPDVVADVDGQVADDAGSPPDRQRSPMRTTGWPTIRWPGTMPALRTGIYGPTIVPSPMWIHRSLNSAATGKDDGLRPPDRGGRRSARLGPYRLVGGHGLTIAQRGPQAPLRSRPKC